jgi:hypothetical protein
MVQYSATVESIASTPTATLRAALNGTEIAGSQVAATLAASRPTVLARSFIAAMAANDHLKLELTGSSTAVDLLGAGDGTTTPSVSITIIRIQ